MLLLKIQVLLTVTFEISAIKRSPETEGTIHSFSIFVFKENVENVENVGQNKYVYLQLFQNILRFKKIQYC